MNQQKRIRRPEGVPCIDEAIEKIEIRGSFLRIIFGQKVNLFEFRDRYIIKLIEPVAGMAMTPFWAEPVCVLLSTFKSDSYFIDVVIPPACLARTTEIYVYTVRDDLTYGSQFEIKKAAS
jgi:hypothetical protein